MGKRTKLSITEQVIDQIFEHEKKPFHVIAAQIADDFCNYSIEFLHGIERGEIQNSKKRKLIIHDDMRKAFSKFNVHLAVIDDIFKHAGIEFDNVDTMHNHDFTFLYTVTGFKIQGKDENEGIILTGTKLVSGSGRIGIESPKIMLDKSSSYQWYNELKDAADVARREVEAYRQGKGTPAEPEEEEKADPNQGNLFATAGDVDRDDSNELDHDFAKASV